MKTLAQIYSEFSVLAGNERSQVAWYEGGSRQARSFAEVWRDADAAAGRLREVGARRVGFFGPTCYNWLVLDLACLLGGRFSVAFPEALSPVQLERLGADHPVDVLLVFAGWEERARTLPGRRLSFSPSGRIEPQAAAAACGNLGPGRILEEYTVAFSSGTTGLPKPIPVRAGFLATCQLEAFDPDLFRARPQPRGDDRWIFFMPFSHLQQRLFACDALRMGVDILLSDPANCFIHLPRERPNIMASVPSVYETLAALVEKELKTFGPLRRAIWRGLNALGVNRLGRRHPLKRLYDRWVVGRAIGGLCGGRPDVFLMGSAPSKRAALDVLWSAGIPVYEGYGQTEMALIALNVPGACRLGSVGRPAQEIRLSSEGEVRVKFDPRRHHPGSVKVEADGFVATGDLGRLDADGFLTLVGRVNDVLVLRNGKKVLPAAVEAAYRPLPGVQAAVAFEADGLALALIVADETDEAGLVEAVRRSGADLSADERPHRLFLLRRGAYPREKLYTGSGKVIRGAVAQAASAAGPGLRLPAEASRPLPS